jgi:hypothetical protein
MRFGQNQDVKNEVVRVRLGFGAEFVENSDSVIGLVLDSTNWVMYGSDADADARYLLTCQAMSLA